jgi:hypothetical protein
MNLLGFQNQQPSTYLVRPKCGFFADIDAKALAAG